MDNYNLFYQNTALMAAANAFLDTEKQNRDMLDDVLNGYDDVSREQIEAHLSKFSSKEELEHYVHNLAIRNKDIHKWE